MSLFHIDSREIVGQPYQGYVEVTSSFVGDWRVKLSKTSTSSIPWCWPGVDQLVLRRGGVKSTVTFGTQKSSNDSAALETILAAVYAGTTVARTFVDGIPRYTVTFTAATDVLWDESTFNSVFSGKKSNETAITSLVLEGYNVSDSPPFLELALDKSVGGLISQRSHSGDLIIEVGSSEPDTLVTLEDGTTLWIYLRRTTCPVTVPWDGYWAIVLSK